MSELLDSLKMFHDGLVQLNTQSAVSDAREALNAANLDAKNKDERLQMSQAIGQDLSMRLMGGGMAPEQAAAATHSLAPPASVTATNEFQRQSQVQAEKFQSEQQSKLFSQQKTIEQMKLDAMAGKAGSKAYDEQTKSFEKRPDVTNIIKHLPDLAGTLDELKQGANKPESVMFSTLAKIGMLKNANGGRPSQQEFQSMSDSPAWYDQVRRQMGLQTTNALPADKQQFWVGVLSRAQDRMKTDMSRLIDSHSSAAEDLNDHISGERLNGALRKKYSSYINNPLESASSSGAAKTVAKKMYSPSRNQTKLIYSDGTEEIQPGQK